MRRLSTSEKKADSLLFVSKEPEKFSAGAVQKQQQVWTVPLNKNPEKEEKALELIKQFESLQAGDVEKRVKLLNELTEIGFVSEAITNFLLGLLMNPSDVVREKAIVTIGKLKWSSAKLVSGLIVTLRDNNDKIRSASAMTLGQLKITDVSIPVLSELMASLSDEDENVRINITIVLAKLGKADSNVLIKLISALFTETNNVKSATSKALIDANIDAGLFLALMMAKRNVFETNMILQIILMTKSLVFCRTILPQTGVPK